MAAHRSTVTGAVVGGVVGGVDTHKHTHYAAAIDEQGRLLGHREFAATDRGYQALLAWMREHGPLTAIGVESTGSFGATLTRALSAAGERVVEVNRPNRLARRLDGKSDRLDAPQYRLCGADPIGNLLVGVDDQRRGGSRCARCSFDPILRELGRGSPRMVACRLATSWSGCARRRRSALPRYSIAASVQPASAMVRARSACASAVLMGSFAHSWMATTSSCMSRALCGRSQFRYVVRDPATSSGRWVRRVVRPRCRSVPRGRTACPGARRGCPAVGPGCGRSWHRRSASRR